MKLKFSIAVALLGASFGVFSQSQPTPPNPNTLLKQAPRAPVVAPRAVALSPTAVAPASSSGSTTANSLASVQVPAGPKPTAGPCCNSPAVSPFARKGAPNTLSEAVAGSTVASGAPSSLKSTSDTAAGPATGSSTKNAHGRRNRKGEKSAKKEITPIETWEEPVNVTVLGTVDGFHVMRSGNSYLFKSTKSLKIVKKPVQPLDTTAIASNAPGNSPVAPPAVPAFGPNNTGLPSIVGRPNPPSGAQPFSLGQNPPPSPTAVPPTYGQRAANSNNSMPLSNPGATGTRVVPGGGIQNPTVANPSAGVAPVNSGHPASGRNNSFGPSRSNAPAATTF